MEHNEHQMFSVVMSSTVIVDGIENDTSFKRRCFLYNSSPCVADPNVYIWERDDFHRHKRFWMT